MVTRVATARLSGTRQLMNQLLSCFADRGPAGCCGGCCYNSHTQRCLARYRSTGAAHLFICVLQHGCRFMARQCAGSPQSGALFERRRPILPVCVRHSQRPYRRPVVVACISLPGLWAPRAWLLHFIRFRHTTARLLRYVGDFSSFASHQARHFPAHFHHTQS